MSSYRLTKSEKDVFVKRVLADVPRVDYHPQFQTAVDELVLACLPPKLAEVFADKALRSALAFTSISNKWNGLGDARTPQYLYSGAKFLAALSAVAERFGRPCAEQWNRDAQLRHGLLVRIDALTTRSSIAKALPEFEKYLPAENAPPAYPLADGSLITEFVKAGWPKGAPAPIASAQP